MNAKMQMPLQWERTFVATPSDDPSFRDPEVYRLMLREEGGTADEGFADVYRPCISAHIRAAMGGGATSSSSSSSAPSRGGTTRRSRKKARVSSPSSSDPRSTRLRLRATGLESPDAAASTLSALQSEVGDKLLYACHGEVVQPAGDHGAGVVVSSGGLMTGIPAQSLGAGAEVALFSMARPVLLALVLA